MPVFFLLPSRLVSWASVSYSRTWALGCGFQGSLALLLFVLSPSPAGRPDGWLLSSLTR